MELGSIKVLPDDNIGSIRVPPDDNIGSIRVPPDDNIGSIRVLPDDNIGSIKVLPDDNIGNIKVPPDDNSLIISTLMLYICSKSEREQNKCTLPWPCSDHHCSGHQLHCLYEHPLPYTISRMQPWLKAWLGCLLACLAMVVQR